MKGMRVLEPMDDAARKPEFLDWLREHGIEPKDTYKVKIGNKHFIAYRFQRGEDGHIVVEGEGDERHPATLPPVSVPKKRTVPV